MEALKALEVEITLEVEMALEVEVKAGMLEVEVMALGVEAATGGGTTIGSWTTAYSPSPCQSLGKQCHAFFLGVCL